MVCIRSLFSDVNIRKLRYLFMLRHEIKVVVQFDFTCRHFKCMMIIMLRYGIQVAMHNNFASRLKHVKT